MSNIWGANAHLLCVAMKSKHIDNNHDSGCRKSYGDQNTAVFFREAKEPKINDNIGSKTKLLNKDSKY